MRRDGSRPMRLRCRHISGLMITLREKTLAGLPNRIQDLRRRFVLFFFFFFSETTDNRSFN